MAGTRRNDLLGRLADLSEETIQRLGDVPGADRVLGAMNSLRDRVDELQKRVRGLEALEQRRAAVERKLERRSKPGATWSLPSSRAAPNAACGRSGTTTRRRAARRRAGAGAVA